MVDKVDGERNSVTGGSGRAALYAAVGADVVHYDVDVDGVALFRRDTFALPATVQYAWQHASRRYLYVASSGRVPGGRTHHITALRIDAATGALQPHGEPVLLRQRPNHMSTDVPSEHALISHTDGDLPSELSVHQIKPDGTLGKEMQQPVLDLGIHAHQVRVAPSNKVAIVVARGNHASGDRPEEPGALKVFDYQEGRLSNHASIAPGGGYGFGPRHLDFHPTRPWVFVCLERQNKLYVHKLEGNTLSPEPLYQAETLADPGDTRAGHRQLAGAIHVHPSGRYLYVANRAYKISILPSGQRVFAYVGGENSIAVYAVDESTGEPTRIQNVDTRGFYVRTFSLDPSGRMLVAGNSIALAMDDGSTVPASLAAFRIGGDGKLDYVRKYDVDVGSKSMFWMGIKGL